MRTWRIAKIYIIEASVNVTLRTWSRVIYRLVVRYRDTDILLEKYILYVGACERQLDGVRRDVPMSKAS